MNDWEVRMNDGNEYTLSVEKVSIRTMLLIIPVVIIYALPFYLVWGKNVLTELRFRSLLFLFVFIVLGIVIHELLHGIVWAVFSKHGFRSVHFGIKWEYLTPYCHCTEPLKVWQYVAGGLAPLLFMGLIPGIMAMFNGNALWMFFAIFFSVAAGGDIQAVWMLRKFHGNQIVCDHPEELGFIIQDESIINDGEVQSHNGNRTYT
ncbi:MAG: DUF3267 domain-containing protein [Bacteroidales bacterium]|jgi:hypothetical protein